MVRQVVAAQRVAQLGKQERDKAHDPLHAEQYDGGEAHPRMQTVQVGYWLGRFVVRVERGLECDRGKHKHGHVDHTVQYFHIQLGRVSEYSINQNGLKQQQQQKMFNFL